MTPFVAVVAATMIVTGSHEASSLRGPSWLREKASIMQSDPAAPRTLDKGDQSNIEDEKQMVARTEAEWTALWTKHSGDRKKPAVDFSREMVVGVFMGSRPTAGYTVTILSSFEKDGKMLVRYRETQPAAGTLTAQILTSPFHLVAVPKVAGTVSFEKVP
jgi:hypothetical protein